MTRASANPTPTEARAASSRSPAGAEEVGRSYFAALAARDAKAAAGHYAAEGVDDRVPLGIFRGPDEIGAFWREAFAAAPDLETVVRALAGDDQTVAVQWRSTATFAGAASFQGIEPTGKRVELRGVDWIEVEDGKIRRNTGYWDGAAFARDIGMMPARGSAAEKAMIVTFNAASRLRHTSAAEKLRQALRGKLDR